MANLLVDISFLEHLATLVDAVVSEVEQSQRASQSAFILEEAGWQGQFRQNFDQVYAEFAQVSHLIIQSGQDLSQRIRQTNARFEQIEGSTRPYSG